MKEIAAHGAMLLFLMRISIKLQCTLSQVQQQCPGPSLSGFTRKQLTKHYMLATTDERLSCLRHNNCPPAVTLNQNTGFSSQIFTPIVIASAEYSSVGKKLAHSPELYNKFIFLKHEVITYIEGTFSVMSNPRFHSTPDSYFYTMYEVIKFSQDCRGDHKEDSITQLEKQSDGHIGLFFGYDMKQCQKNDDLFAYGTDCAFEDYLRDSSGAIYRLPIAGVVIICPGALSSEADPFPSILHAALHTMGFSGTYLHVVPSLYSIKDMEWAVQEDRPKLYRYKLLFQGKQAVKAAKKHFLCRSLSGVELENYLLMHESYSHRDGFESFIKNPLVERILTTLQLAALIKLDGTKLFNRAP